MSYLTTDELQVLHASELKTLCHKKKIEPGRTKEENVHLLSSKIHPIDLTVEQLRAVLDKYDASYTVRMRKDQLITLLNSERNSSSGQERNNRFGTPPPRSLLKCSISPCKIPPIPKALTPKASTPKATEESFLVSAYELLSMGNKRGENVNNVQWLKEEFIPFHLTDKNPTYVNSSLWDQLQTIVALNPNSKFLSRDELEEICLNYEAYVGEQWKKSAHETCGIDLNTRRRTKQQFVSLINIYKNAIPDPQVICDQELILNYVTPPSYPAPKPQTTKIQRSPRSSPPFQPSLSVAPPIQKAQSAPTDLVLQKLQQTPGLLQALQTLLNNI